jgi:hypothetical protein
VISPSVMAVDLATSIERILRTILAAVATVWRAASPRERGLVPGLER